MHPKNLRLFRRIIGVLLIGSAGPLAGAQPARVSPAKPSQAAPGAGQPSGDSKPTADPKSGDSKEYKTADELLGALETADEKIRTISAELNFTTKTGEIEGGDTQLRHGWLYFRNGTEAKEIKGQKDTKSQKDAATPAPGEGPAACVRFDYMIQSNKQYPERKAYVVNGTEVIEKVESEKLMNRYKIGEKGEAGGAHNPLKLGQGPFPLPFGQKKEEVEARFEPDLRPALEGLEKISEGLKERLSPTYQLKLTPKSGAGVSSKVKEVRVWYQKSDLLPVLARIMRPDGGFDEFYLVGIQVNKSLPPGIFDTSVPEGWKVEEKQRP